MQTTKTVKILLAILMVIFMAAAFGIYFFDNTVNNSKVTALYDNSGNINLAKREDYTHCLWLQKDSVILINATVRTAMSYDVFTRKPETLVLPEQVNIIFGKETDYNQVTKALDLMAERKIKKYQLLKF